ncbi:hypothetical protein [Maridesulfovibrio ferrireducens]|uniref:hypothetical protein n=1 Tax=Maridesulfovibrio ferrireducens TaxID=246191 RepID=UPI001A2F8FC1|nr:hypothetical protein [Maridesulfovibrio ferrireducens]MBI9110012.1 hypothetical protein [Maridesulfovibrio ferrireducens]
MDAQIRLQIDDNCNPADTLETLSNGIKTLTNCITGDNKNETESIKLLIKVLAGGVKNIAEKIQ